LEITNALAYPSYNSRTVADIVERDATLSARVLELIHSGLHRLPQPLTSIVAAVAFLGVERIKALVLAVEVAKLFPLTQPVPLFSLDALQKRGLVAGQLAKQIWGPESRGDLLEQAGTLQGVGQLVLAARAPQRFAIALQTSARGKLPLYEAELGLFGATHAEIGSDLLGLWGLPEKLVQAVAHHLQPNREARSFDAGAALYVANLLAENPNLPALDEIPARTVALDLRSLRALGVAHRLDDWRRFARELSSERAGARP
jgi:HD-like signal output (HDOD) protein